MEIKRKHTSVANVEVSRTEERAGRGGTCRRAEAEQVNPDFNPPRELEGSTPPTRPDGGLRKRMTEWVIVMVMANSHKASKFVVPCFSIIFKQTPTTTSSMLSTISTLSQSTSWDSRSEQGVAL